MLCQALEGAGISSGPRAELLEAQCDNTEGFFENRRLVDINESLLSIRDSSWIAPMCGSISSGDVRDDIREREVLLSDLQAYAPSGFFLKDPRLCLTLPLWMKLAPSALVVFVYRAPLAVAKSLQKRNHFPLQMGLALWEIYNRRALEALRDSDFLRINFDSVIAGEDSLSRIVSELKDRGFDCDPSKADAVFKPSLTHNLSADDDPDLLLLTDSQNALHAYCEALCRGETVDLPSLEDEDRVLARLHDLASAVEPLATVVETGIARDEAIALSEERMVERDSALQTLSSLESDHDALASAHKAEQSAHRKAAQVLVGLRGEHEALAEAHEREVAEHASLSKAHVSLVDQYHKDTTELQEKADYLFHEITTSYGDLVNFEQSTLGRLLHQTRRAYRFFTGQRGRNSAYEDVLARAVEHHQQYELELPVLPPSKWRMASDVVTYVIRNPAGSLRSFSWSRLRRATSVFFGSSADDLQVWVNARFPDSNGALPVFDPERLDPDLDVLELNFVECASPEVSIIVPVYNDYRVTMNCLRAVHKHTVDIAYEVILADDCSTDLTTTIQQRVSGIKVSRTRSNLRFLKNCNQAARQARGEVLVFLNNDTAVTADWLTPLLAPLDDPQVGVVGPKLLFADGVLQEAGGIIWDDASGWNFGRGDSRDKPAFNYRRPVDYVSGACLAIRHTLWMDLGGFDERFAPAYYEDADICFAARAAGYDVIYEPSSVVYHFEGVSNGTDLASGVKQHQVTNQAVFREKWQSVLESEHFPNAESVIHARDRSVSKYTVLVIDHYVPHFDKDAGGRSTFQYIELLVEMGCRVQFMGANFFPHQPYTRRLQELGVEVLVGESVARHLDAWLVEHAPYIDEVFLHRPHVAEQFLPHLKRLETCPPISFFGHDLHYLRMTREAELKGDPALLREAERWRQRELAVCKDVDHAYYFSQVEIDELADQVPKETLRLVPLYAMPVADVPAYQPSEPRSILFVGGYNHPPNVDAVLWLVNDILPIIETQLDDVHIHLVGSNAPSQITDLAAENVTVHGYLSDDALAAMYRDIALAVVPLQYGAGVKGKVIEAISHGAPLLTTNVGAEGIPEASEVMWIADSANELADAAVKLLGESDLAQAKLAKAQDWISRNFSKSTAAAVLAADRKGWTAERAAK